MRNSRKNQSSNVIKRGPGRPRIHPIDNAPKRRGRPPGSKNKTSRVSNDAPKRRGRPPGSKNKNTRSTANSNGNVSVKRRGRPPGSKNINSAVRSTSGRDSAVLADILSILAKIHQHMTGGASTGQPENSSAEVAPGVTVNINPVAPHAPVGGVLENPKSTRKGRTNANPSPMPQGDAAPQATTKTEPELVHA